MSIKHCSQSDFYQHFIQPDREQRMGKVVFLTCFMMVAEIVGGLLLGSMALLADGFHMMTHTVALGISAFAYAYARHHARDPRYSFGTGKVGDLAGFTSAVILILITAYVAYESTARLIHPVQIIYRQAIPIAFVGLIVNVISAFILHGHEEHQDHHDHSHSHAHSHSHHDNNFRAAYVHIIADAVTSVTALAALFCGMEFGWRWLDPVMGLVGAGVILSWAWGLLCETSTVLLDRDAGTEISGRIHRLLVDQGIEISDLHILRVGQGCYAAILAVSVPAGIAVDHIREQLQPLGLAHITIEIVPSITH